MPRTTHYCNMQTALDPHSEQPPLQLEKADLLFKIHKLDEGAASNHLMNNIPHQHNSFKLIWVLEGNGQYRVDGEQQEVGPNQVYCLTPGQIHQFKLNRNIKGYVITFSQEFLLMPKDNASLIFHPNSFHQLAGTTVIRLTEDLRTEMEDLVVKMLKEYDNFFLLRAEILKGLLNIFMIYLTRQYNPVAQPAPKQGNRSLVNRFFSIVEQKYMVYKLVADYADELAVTPNHLNEMVKKVSGFPASHHIRQRVVLEAKRQATYSGSSMKEIAYSLGFDDIAHFSKFFKNFSGRSFTDYKKEAMQQYLSM
ncbi:helix-turn-helix domain-containing protein [Chitinophaga filiformis]|uniref:Helix-turn-helix transcriptional regulator n=1 Tax=Chitinophaga filiformis TaxID=104663 RepID=A0ABY4HYB4_CHIFI|nr:helix-turn-helix domain-containing protein [Chitinophaga filiformis]UPK68385.1 helix-turn-helix transcriptional regulator [Chitinophaga filiformis]